MSPRDLLGVLVRLGGLISLSFSFFDVYHIIIKMAGTDTLSPYPISVDVRGLISWGIFGVLLIICADPIVRLVYWADIGRLHELGRHR